MSVATKLHEIAWIIVVPDCRQHRHAFGERHYEGIEVIPVASRARSEHEVTDNYECGELIKSFAQVSYEALLTALAMAAGGGTIARERR